MKYEFGTVARLVEGKLNAEDRRGFLDAMRAFRGEPFLVKVGPIQRGRSLNQNRYYWGVVLALLSEHTGHTPMELHEYFKARYNSDVLMLVNRETGEIVDERTIAKTTTTMSTEQFTAYLEQIIQCAAELGCVVPPSEAA